MSAASEVKIDPAVPPASRAIAATIVKEALLDLGEVAEQLAEPTDNAARVLERLSEELAAAAGMVRPGCCVGPRSAVARRLFLFGGEIAGHVAHSAARLGCAARSFEERANRARDRARLSAIG